MIFTHSHMRASQLRTPKTVWDYPDRWELLRWYLCWRKFPYGSEVIATLNLFGRASEYGVYACRYGEHWHVGRGRGRADPKKLTQRAKARYRRDVRHEIWERHERGTQPAQEEKAVG